MSDGRRRMTWGVLACVASAVVLGTGFSGAKGQGENPRGPKKVALVELFVSQGCDMCPSAEQLIGRLRTLGYGPERVVPLVFHGDYFNDPWVDPFSDPQFSQREAEYSRLYDRANGLGKPDYLYFTPMLMVD